MKSIKPETLSAVSAWQAFEQSGRVADYLSYISCVRGRSAGPGAPTAETVPYADQNNGPGAQTPEYW